MSFFRPHLILASVLLAGSAAADAPAESGNVTADAACAKLCEDLYTSDSGKRGLCEEGCAAAAACTKDCADRFSDEKTRERCNYRCARAR